MFIKFIRNKKGLSQRDFAALTGVAYGTLQRMEGGHDLRLSTLLKVADGLGYAPKDLSDHLSSFFETPTTAIQNISRRIVDDGFASWKIHLFNFVDDFLEKKDSRLVEDPPLASLSPRLQALLASSVESLCDQLHHEIPLWCEAIPPLKIPWFPSGVENLKALALLESPVHFRKRNIFVLGNFLERR